MIFFEKDSSPMVRIWMKRPVSPLAFVFFILSALLILSACKREEDRKKLLFTDPVTVLLEPEQTVLYLSDYFSNPGEVVIKKCPHWLDCVVVDNDSVVIELAGEPLPLGILSLREGDFDIDLLVRSSEKKPVQFRLFDPDAEYEKVATLGDFNSWDPGGGEMVREGDYWKGEIFINPGTYGYQFEVDGERILDPENPDSLDNNMGGLNSKLEIYAPPVDELPHIVTGVDGNGNPWFRVDGNYDEIKVLYGSREVDPGASEEGRYYFQESLSAFEPADGFLLVQAYSEKGAGPNLRIPMHQNKWTINPTRDRSDLWHNTIMYFLMVDRFRNGNPDNDQMVDDDRIKPIANYFGGDLEGVIEVLEEGYFSELGVNSIWLSPIVQNPEGAYGFWDKGGVQSKFSGYHGYWPVSFTQIDHRFGTPEDLRKLVDLANEDKKRIILDLVANHVHENHPFYIENKDRDDYFTDLYLPDGTLNTERWDDHRLTTWFDTFMPTLELRTTEVAEVVSDSAVYWLREYGVHGFRHDATKHVPLSFWRKLTAKIDELSRETGMDYFQIGETYGSPELIGSYLGPGLLDAQFDFNLYDALISSIIRPEVSLELLSERLLESQKYYGTNHLMGNMSGNQDKTRIMSFATGEVAFDEDGKLAGWTRDIDKTTEEGFERVALIHAVNFFIPGIPVIYYGDEIGVPGGNDPDNRRMMQFTDLDDDQLFLKNQVARLAELRTHRSELILGDLRIVDVGDNHLTASRNYFGQCSWLVINTGDETGEFSFSTDYPDGEYSSLNNREFVLSDDTIEIALPPRSFEIISVNHQ